ncbi:hypothetical protein BSZ36_16395 [Rubricoccus marinus]|uniref:Uncharacterized protein n=2 Tax=Rubricoccus marinus TaxID=716817 RepID=A0A259U380_9BACT|nr:hypothetical protein BSZ36_16395 [Rubricoccus marinus]
MQEETAVGDPEDDTSPQGRRGRDLFRSGLRIPLAALAFLGAVALVGTLVARGDVAAQKAPDSPASAAAPAAPPIAAGEAYAFRQLDIHPDRMHGKYFAGAFLTDASPEAAAEGDMMSDFRWRLEMFRKAYGVDDNFTIRAYDGRNGRELDAVTLTGMRNAYRASGSVNWDEVNRARRTATTELRQKLQAAGIPRKDIVIRWGYKDNSLEARSRDNHFVEYEAQLARRLGLSLLTTEIGTVETFNQDHLISSAGARSRYQMMPDILSMFNVERYNVPLAGGGSVGVAEELHPLLSMEPALMLVRAYSNAVGHELPGISAYHAGVANIHKLYREYLRANPLAVRSNLHVSDAYMWGITDGFEKVDAVSSFGPHSRIYVLKAYGALRATEDQVIDPSETARVERVQVRAGERVTLERILAALESVDQRLDWSYADGDTAYERFRQLNPHIKLPMAPGTSGVPDRGNLVLTSAAGGEPIRFFLPAGAVEAMKRTGLDVIGEMTSFDEDTFVLDPSEVTPTDREYQALVDDIGQFGFTRANKARLETLYSSMNALARQNPDSRYRQTQSKIIGIHRMFWRTSAFESLVSTRENLLSINPLDLRNDSLASGPLPAPIF